MLHIPHDSSYIPLEFVNDYIISPQELELEQKRLVDWYTAELFSSGIELGAAAVISKVSRFVFDAERFESNQQERMSEVGMGVFYTHGTQRQEIRRAFTAERREQLLEQLYRPYHQALNEIAAAHLTQFGKCFVLDCHSFPEHMLPYEGQQYQQRPDICFGFNMVEPNELVQRLAGICAVLGYSYAFNEPFAGVLLPGQYFNDPRVAGLMIEVNRRLYLNEATAEKLPEFGKTKALIEELIGEVVESVSEGAI